MRAPVAAQVCHCLFLLLKSISQPTVIKKSRPLAFDKAMFPKRAKNLVDGAAALRIDKR